MGQAVLISESGLYKLIMRSDKETAKPFQDWVTKEVLPSIRKTGAFVTGQPSIVENPSSASSGVHAEPSQSAQERFFRRWRWVGMGEEELSARTAEVVTSRI
jgi:prophage antirepressor-like protein